MRAILIVVLVKNNYNFIRTAKYNVFRFFDAKSATASDTDVIHLIAALDRVFHDFYSPKNKNRKKLCPRLESLHNIDFG